MFHDFLCRTAAKCRHRPGPHKNLAIRFRLGRWFQPRQGVQGQVTSVRTRRRHDLELRAWTRTARISPRFRMAAFQHVIEAALREAALREAALREASAAQGGTRPGLAPTALPAPRTSDRIHCLAMVARRSGSPRHPRRQLLRPHHRHQHRARQAIPATIAAAASVARAAAAQAARAAPRTSVVPPWWAKTWRRHTTARIPRWRLLQARHPCMCAADMVLVIADQGLLQMPHSSL